MRVQGPARALPLLLTRRLPLTAAGTERVGVDGEANLARHWIEHTAHIADYRDAGVKMLTHHAVGTRTMSRSTSLGSTRITRGPLRYAGRWPAAMRRRSVRTLRPVRLAASVRDSNWRMDVDADIGCSLRLLPKP